MASMAASFDKANGTDARSFLMFPMPGGRQREGGSLAPASLVPMLSPGTWAASSQVIGELEQHQDLVVFDIQTSKPFEAWLNIDKSRSDEVAGAVVQNSGRTIESYLGNTPPNVAIGDHLFDKST
jgi:hypothetical protein